MTALNPNSIYRSYAHYNMGRIYYDRRQLARAKSEFENVWPAPTEVVCLFEIYFRCSCIRSAA